MTDHNADAGAGGFGSSGSDIISEQEQAVGPAMEATVVENDQAVRSDETNYLRNDAAAAVAETSHASVKNKRVADRQITKDDKEDDHDSSGNEQMPSCGFTKADAATMAKRRILKAKRPEAQRVEVSTAASSQINPFAAVTLASASKFTGSGDQSAANNDVGATKSTPTSSNNPFANIALKASGPSSSTESTVFGSTSGFFGFLSNNPSSSLFGGTSTATSSPSNSVGIFGSSASTSNGLGTSWFSPPSSATPFAFAAAPVAVTISNSNSDAPTATDNKKDILPEHVELSTGEEGEQLVLELRAKTYKRVLGAAENSGSPSNPSQQLSSAGGGDQDGTTPSVPPSSATAPMVAKVVGEDTASPCVVSKNEGTALGKAGSEGKNDSGIPDSKAEAGGQSVSAQSLEWRWQEAGTGPLRLLGRAMDSNGSASQWRLVQRRESTPNGPATKVIVNVYLWKETTIQRPSEKHVQITTLVYESVAAAVPVPETYLFKLKAASEATQLHGKLEELVSKAKSCVGSNNQA